MIKLTLAVRNGIKISFEVGLSYPTPGTKGRELMRFSKVLNTIGFDMCIARKAFAQSIELMTRIFREPPYNLQIVVLKLVKHHNYDNDLVGLGERLYSG